MDARKQIFHQEKKMINLYVISERKQHNCQINHQSHVNRLTDDEPTKAALIGLLAYCWNIEAVMLSCGFSCKTKVSWSSESRSIPWTLSASDTSASVFSDCWCCWIGIWLNTWVCCWPYKFGWYSCFLLFFPSFFAGFALGRSLMAVFYEIREQVRGM